MRGGHNKKELSIWISPKGYVMERIWTTDGKRKFVRQHRLVMEKALGRPLLRSEDVHHLDGNRANNELSNLQVLDHVAHAKLTNAERPKDRLFKLNETLVKKIKTLISEGRSFSSLGREYSVHWTTIQSIAKGTIWKSVQI